MYRIWCQSVRPFGSFPRLKVVTPKTPEIMEGRIVFSLCPFPDEYAEVYQIWCQSVQLFDSFPRLLNLCPPKTPSGIEGQIVFSLCPFPDESVDNRSSRLTASPNIWICGPLKKPRNAPAVLWSELYLAYVHSQTNPPTCTKCGANRCRRLTASQDFWICDPLPPPPQCSLGYWGATWI